MRASKMSPVDLLTSFDQQYYDVAAWRSDQGHLIFKPCMRAPLREMGAL